MCVVLIIIVLQSAACREDPDPAVVQAPAVIEKIEGSELSRVTLTERAMQRLNLRTDQVREMKMGPESSRTVVPYSSLIYDLQGQTWIYISPRPGTFVRHEVEVDYIEDDLAVLHSGPSVGTVVASVGVAELYGAEFKVGH
jgi:hypothetical protein